MFAAWLSYILAPLTGSASFEQSYGNTTLDSLETCLVVHRPVTLILYLRAQGGSPVIKSELLKPRMEI